MFKAAVGLIVVLLMASPFIGRPPDAAACSCMPPPEDADGMRQMFGAEGYSDDWIMVSGKADARSASPVPYSSTTGFTVERVYRGRAPERIVLVDAEDGASCGMTVPTAGRQFVVARLETQDLYEPTFCGSFTITASLQAELDDASEGSAPIVSEGAESGDLPLLPIGLVFGATALLSAVVILRRRHAQS